MIVSSLSPLSSSPPLTLPPPQRCVVVHMTNGLLVEDNVAFHTRGHCFILEEGGETNNTFLHNLGMWQMAGGLVGGW